jgi:MOSC domain-containing protein YiiM
VVSLNVGIPRPLRTGKGTVLSGIVKTPVTGARMVRTLNIEGDGQADLKVHGGRDKAVYCYPFEHYALWASELSRDDLGPGSFGENLTIAGLTEATVSVGDVLEVGGARLQVTKPRQPCFKLAAHIGRPDFPRLFLASRRTGWYARVLEEGLVSAGDRVSRQEAGHGPTVDEVVRRIQRKP